MPSPPRRRFNGPGQSQPDKEPRCDHGDPHRHDGISQCLRSAAGQTPVQDVKPDQARKTDQQLRTLAKDASPGIIGD